MFFDVQKVLKVRFPINDNWCFPISVRFERDHGAGYDTRMDDMYQVRIQNWEAPRRNIPLKAESVSEIDLDYNPEWRPRYPESDT